MGETLSTDKSSGVSRRSFLKGSAGAAPALAGLGTAARAAAGAVGAPSPELEEATVVELQRLMSAGELTAAELTAAYIQRIAFLDSSGPAIKSILEVNPEAASIAKRLDRERRERGPRGPLHGIPVLLKDNIDTADKMETTAGSLALLGTRPPRDATVARRLRAAGAVILGKTNLSEWANFRSLNSSSGWSARGGQSLNPYALDRSPCGSSSGSATAVAANLAAASLGTETDGSIVCPASANAVVGIKPTVGLTSRAGVIPIAHSQDTVGPFGRTVADAAAVLGALTGVDPRDPATRASRGHRHDDYTQFLDPGALEGARIGVPRTIYYGYSEEADRIAERAIEAMARAGATIVDPAEIPTAVEISESDAEFTVLLYEFKADIKSYLAERGDTGGVNDVRDLIAFNRANAKQEMPFFKQEIFLLAQDTGSLSDAAYLEALRTSHRLSRRDGIDAVMNDLNLDALVAPTGSPTWKIDLINGDHFLGGSSSPAAMAGYPIVTVPAGYSFGMPVGMSFIGGRFAEPKLIALAHSFEQATRKRHKPRFRPTDLSAPSL